MRRDLLFAGLWAVALVPLGGAATTSDVTFTRALALQPAEGVFAYSRISPDGRILAYASQKRDEVTGRIHTTQNVVDLATQKVAFHEPGIDAYWSTDGTRMIFLSQTGAGGVSIRHHPSGTLARSVAPASLGDYFSWAFRDGKHLILTIQSNYYYLDGDRAVLPAARVPACEGIGVGERPLISKDGRRISTFVRGEVVVRNLTDCGDIVNTGLQGAKADFSFDGRYIAFHIPKATPRAYEIVVVDLQKRTMRAVTAGLAGSSLFPSWTQDGRLSFRYDGDDYRGFMFASNVLSAPERPLPPASAAAVPPSPRWSDLFPETPVPPQAVSLVMIWATWSAHSPDALRQLQDARNSFGSSDVAVFTAIDPASRRDEADRLRQQDAITVPELPFSPGRFTLTEAVNQIPTTLLFKNGRMVDRRLGAQTTGQLRDWTLQYRTPGSMDR